LETTGPIERNRVRRSSRPAVARLLGYAVIPVALLATGLFVTSSSYSVFNAGTANPANSWAAGSLTLVNDSGSAMLTATGIKPGGAAITRCITVTSNGTVPASVKLYGASATTTNALSTYLNLQIEAGTATSTTGGACTGFTPSSTIFPAATLASFSSGRTTFTNGVATGWSIAGTTGETRAFRFTVTPLGTMTNTQQGGTAGIDFVWEAQST
jgi:hypothetical protein